MDLSKPVPLEAIIVAISFFILIIVGGILTVKKFRRKI